MLENRFDVCESAVCTSVKWSTRTHLGFNATLTAPWPSTSDWLRPWNVRQSDTATLLWSATLFLTYLVSSIAPVCSTVSERLHQILPKIFWLALRLSLVGISRFFFPNHILNLYDIYINICSDAVKSDDSVCYIMGVRFFLTIER